jgi:hypothetical protein
MTRSVTRKLRALIRVEQLELAADILFALCDVNGSERAVRVQRLVEDQSDRRSPTKSVRRKKGLYGNGEKLILTDAADGQGSEGVYVTIFPDSLNDPPKIGNKDLI